MFSPETTAAGERDLCFLLGVGGARPRIDRFEQGANSTTTLVELPLGQSVYSLTRHRAGHDFAIAGTKGGRIYHLTYGEVDGADEPTQVRELIQGAPVLSTCYLTADQIVVSDCAGRCLLWSLKGGGEPKVLETGGRTVCSLIQLDDDHIAGLAISGELLSWYLPDLRLTRTVPALVPPRRVASVRLLKWSSRRVLAYPGVNGKLALFSYEDGGLRVLSAHEGDFYAMLILQGDLVTIGLMDGRMKRWSLDKCVLRETLAAPKGIMAAGALCCLSPKLLLVGEDGEAQVCQVGVSELDSCRRVEGCDFRSIAAPDWDEIEPVIKCLERDRATQLAASIRTSIARDASWEAEEHHSQLTDLGYEHVSLALRAEHARRINDLTGELSAYRDLMAMLPQSGVEVPQSLARYASLLERTWQIKEACVIYQRLAPAHPNAATMAYRLLPFQEALNVDGTVVESDLPVSVILDAAAGLDLPAPGRLLMKMLSPLSCHCLGIEPHQILAKYDELRAEHAHASLPEGSISCTPWLTRDRVEEVILVSFVCGERTGSGNVAFGLRVMNETRQTVVVPVVIFQSTGAPRDSTTHPIPVHGIGSVDQANIWLREMHHTLITALNRLTTELLAIQRGGNAHGSLLPRL